MHDSINQGALIPISPNPRDRVFIAPNAVTISPTRRVDMAFDITKLVSGFTFRKANGFCYRILHTPDEVHPLYEIVEFEYPILKKGKIRLIQFHTPEELVDFIQDKPAPTNPSIIIGKDKGIVVNIISGDGTPLDTESTSITIKDGTKSAVIHCEKDELDAISLQASREAIATEMNKRGYHDHRQEFFDNIRRYLNNSTDEIMKAITLTPTCYQCPICGEKYDTEKEAQDCVNIGIPEGYNTNITVGAIVTFPLVHHFILGDMTPLVGIISEIGYVPKSMESLATVKRHERYVKIKVFNPRRKQLTFDSHSGFIKIITRYREITISDSYLNDDLVCSDSFIPIAISDLKPADESQSAPTIGPKALDSHYSFPNGFMDRELNQPIQPNLERSFDPNYFKQLWKAIQEPEQSMAPLKYLETIHNDAVRSAMLTNREYRKRLINWFGKIEFEALSQLDKIELYNRLDESIPRTLAHTLAMHIVANNGVLPVEVGERIKHTWFKLLKKACQDMESKPNDKIVPPTEVTSEKDMPTFDRNSISNTLIRSLFQDNPELQVGFSDVIANTLQELKTKLSAANPNLSNDQIDLYFEPGIMGHLINVIAASRVFGLPLSSIYQLLKTTQNIIQQRIDVYTAK